MNQVDEIVLEMILQMGKLHKSSMNSLIKKTSNLFVKSQFCSTFYPVIFPHLCSITAFWDESTAYNEAQ